MTFIINSNSRGTDGEIPEYGENDFMRRRRGLTSGAIKTFKPHEEEEFPETDGFGAKLKPVLDCRPSIHPTVSRLRHFIIIALLFLLASQLALQPPSRF